MTQESPENISDVVSDFNTTKQQLKDLIIRISSQWFVLDIVGHQFTWFNRGKNSCFDFRVINNKLRNYLNIASLCNFINDISDHLPLILFCKKKISSDGFTMPLHGLIEFERINMM